MSDLNIALFQPDIAQNVGTIMRMCACLDITLHVIEPCGFPWDRKKIRQSGMDYIDHVQLVRHDSWDHFLAHSDGARLILMTTKGAQPYTGFTYKSGDYLVAGSESTGAPDYVHDRADGRVLIEMSPQMRSLNVACATAMITGEALRQIK